MVALAVTLVSFLLATAAAKPLDSGALIGEPSAPIDEPREPADFLTPETPASDARLRREVPGGARPAGASVTSAPNRAPTKPAYPSSHQTGRESATTAPHSGLQKPRPLPGSANINKPQTTSGQTGLNGNRQGLTKPAPTASKPTHTNSQTNAQSGLIGNRPGTTKPATLPAHTRPARSAMDEDWIPHAFPGSQTQRPQATSSGHPGPFAELGTPEPPRRTSVGSQVTPAHLGTPEPQPIDDQHRPLSTQGSSPTRFGIFSTDRPVRGTLQGSPWEEEIESQPQQGFGIPVKPLANGSTLNPAPPTARLGTTPS